MTKRGRSTFIGLMVGVSFVVGSIIVSGEPGSFWNLPSAFIIMGGTVGSVIVAFPPKRLKTLMPVMKKAFKKDNYDIKEDIRTIVSLSEIARRQGFLALEDYIAQTNDEF
ncbi:motility protein A [Clostridium intestinale]|uniref:motility protein A n=1 Tax=Clostridium intestinale TaxID=36845 RepID=UPI002DD61FAB|nr:motility-associated protein [Clostridium intestinale]WRY53743.1 hypothetical protein P8F83_11135 [Clostridium intestinale]